MIKKHIVAENWTEGLITKAERSVDKRKQSLQAIFRHKVVFWVSIVIVVKLNLVLSAVLVPFLATLNHPFFDVVIMLAALIVGLFYNFLLVDVAHLEKGHYFLAAVIVPLIAIANVFLVGGVVEQLFGSSRENLWLIAVLYGIVFILPYVFDRVRIVYGRKSLHKAF